MSDLSIALHLTLPEKLAPLYEPRRYKVMHGDPEALKKRLEWLMLAIDPSLPFVVELVAAGEGAGVAPASA